MIRPGLAPAEQGSAVGAHEASDIGSDNLYAHLLLKSPQHRLVVEGTALDHDVPAQLLGRGGPDDLVDGVAHHGHGEAGRDVLNGGAVLLGLLHAGVHEHSAAAAQVHRPLGKQAQLGKLFHVVPQRLGEGLQEAAAAGGACLVELYAVHRAVLNLDAFHVLAADVQDTVNIRLKEGGRIVVGYGLHLALIQHQRCL